jgi:DnaJ family protein C protein 2
MASIGTVALTLSTPPSGYSKPSSGSKLTAPVQLPVYPAGPSFISSARRQILQRSFEEDDKVVLASREAQAKLQNTGGEGDLYPGLGEEEEDRQLLESDPKEWKKQDHYAVLGLGNLRYKATDDHIRVARELFGVDIFGQGTDI